MRDECYSRPQWTLGRRDGIAVYWVAGSSWAEDTGAVRPHEPEDRGNQVSALLRSTGRVVRYAQQ